MFTWICPQCGREVPPSYTECPDCAAKAAGSSNPPSAPGEAAAPPTAYPPPPAQAAPPPPPPQAPPAPQPYSPPTGQYYPPQPYPAQQYPPYPPAQYPPQGYPPQQYPTQPYPPQQYQAPPYPPQYPSQYGPPQYTAPYPPAPPQQQAYAPPAPPRPESAPPYPPPPPPEQPYSEPASARTGTLFGAAPPEPPVYAPPPPPAPPRMDGAPPPASAPAEVSHEPGAPRAGGMLFGPSAGAEPAKRKGLPTWLMAVLFAGGGIAVIWGIYSLVGSSHGTQKPSTTVESPAAKPGAPTNVWQKYIEVSGVRFVENAKKQPVVKFVLTNHAGQDAEGLTGNVTLWGRTQKSEEDAAGTFSFKADVPANSAKDLEAPLTTKLKVYELPDWQYISADLQITGPGGETNAAK